MFYGEFPLQYWGDGTNENLFSQFFDYRLSAKPDPSLGIAYFFSDGRDGQRKNIPWVSSTLPLASGLTIHECEDTLSDIGGVWYQLPGVEDAFHLAHSSCPRTL